MLYIALWILIGDVNIVYNVIVTLYLVLVTLKTLQANLA
jgi:hypothetical protein